MTAHPQAIRNRIVEHADVNPRELLAHPANYKSHPNAQRRALRGSLRELGWLKEVIVNRTTGRIVDGHARVDDAIQQNEKTVPVGWVELTAAEELTALAVLDSIVALAEQDDVKMTELMASVKTEDRELVQFFASLRETDDAGTRELGEEAEEEFDETKPVADAITQLGDLWRLGPHRLLCGDACNPDDVTRLMAGEKARAVVTDPPYAVYGSSTGIAADITDDKMVRPFFRDVVRASVQVLEPFGHAYICCDWRSWASWWEVAKGTGLVPKNLIVWDKGGGLGSSYANAHELLGFFSLIPLRERMTQKITGVRPVNDLNIWKINRVLNSKTAKREHNAQKPAELFARAITNSTDEGDLVVDFFSGSGTTAIACTEHRRRAALMEIDPRWCDVTVKRWETATGETATREAAPASHTP
jgi:DNA modification methylase